MSQKDVKKFIQRALILETTRRDRDLDSLAIMESLVKSNKTLQIEKVKLQLEVSNCEIKLAKMDEENHTLKKDLMEMKGKLFNKHSSKKFNQELSGVNVDIVS